jgi:hypothetical protein
MESQKQEFNLIKIRSATESRTFTVKQSKKRLSLRNNELNEFKIQKNFPKKIATIHGVFLLLIFISQIVLQVIELQINPKFKSGIYSSILASVYGITTVIVLFCLGRFKFLIKKYKIIF